MVFLPLLIGDDGLDDEEEHEREDEKEADLEEAVENDFFMGLIKSHKRRFRKIVIRESSKLFCSIFRFLKIFLLTKDLNWFFPLLPELEFKTLSGIESFIVSFISRKFKNLLISSDS